MTVSRVLNGQANVRQSKREAVILAVEELGYSPNKAARSLASAKQIRIGLLYSNPSSTYLSAMLLGMLEQARQSDTQIVVVECAAGFDTDVIIKQLVKDGVNGIILAPPLCDSQQAFTTLIQNDMPAVTVGAKHGNAKIASVCIDDHQAAVTLTRHLISLGHRRIGFLIGSAGQSSSSERLSGFRDAMRDAGLEVPPEWVVQGTFSYQSGLEAGEQLLSLENPPTAIIASNDDMAAGVIATAHRLNLDVPRDLSICGFDDTLMAEILWPAITTIKQPISEMSKVAIDLLESLIKRGPAGSADQCPHLEMEFSLIRRQSDGPVR